MNFSFLEQTLFASLLIKGNERENELGKDFLNNFYSYSSQSIKNN